MTDSDKIDKLMVDVATLVAKLDSIKEDMTNIKGFESRIIVIEEFQKGLKSKIAAITSGIFVSIGTALWNVLKSFS